MQKMIFKIKKLPSTCEVKCDSKYLNLSNSCRYWHNPELPPVCEFDSLYFLICHTLYATLFGKIKLIFHLYRHPKHGCTYKKMLFLPRYREKKRTNFYLTMVQFQVIAALQKFYDFMNRMIQ